MTYLEAVRYLESFANYEKVPAYSYKESLRLERVKGFLRRIGNPQDGLRCIHIAGSKGKGSTCAFIAYILKEAGFKVGLYTSPHLADFRERIRILQPQASGFRQQAEFEGMIPKEKLARLTSKLKPEIEKYNKSSKYGPLTFFEVYTALAFVYFKQEKVDFAVLETGLGGRFDATNTVRPLVCAITPISYEHTDKLGNTLAKIAREKAGIIKISRQVAPRLRSGQAKSPSHRMIVISAPQRREALEVIRIRCRETGSGLREVKMPARQKIKLLGSHQRINAGVAVAVIKALRAHNIKIGADSIKKGLYDTLWPGRCEVISLNPTVILDGAQNAASAKALRDSVKDNFRYKKLILVLGVSSDKDIKGICRELKPIADKIILTRADSLRALPPEYLAGYFNGKDTYITYGVKEAKRLAQAICRKQDLILATGSLFVVGEFRDAAI